MRRQTTREDVSRQCCSFWFSLQFTYLTAPKPPLTSALQSLQVTPSSLLQTPCNQPNRTPHSLKANHTSNQEHPRAAMRQYLIPSSRNYPIFSNTILLFDFPFPRLNGISSYYNSFVGWIHRIGNLRVGSFKDT